MTDKLIFQTLDWDFFHEDNDDGDGKNYCIRLFGRTKTQESVYLQIDDFKPYFYIEIKPNWKSYHYDAIITEIKRNVSKNCQNGLINMKREEKYKFYGFTNYTKFPFLKLTFHDFDSMKQYARAFQRKYKIYAISKHLIKINVFESNILPHLRFMHIRQLEAVGWVSIDVDKLENCEGEQTCCKLNYKTNWENVNMVEDRMIEKFIIASFDIECASEDGSFPQPQRDGDPIIQIGVTYSRFGESECYYKHLLSLHKTDDIEGVTVEWFKSEEELLLGFTKLMRKTDPDIITGYNIFGFDFNYLMERSKKLGIEHKFSRLSRVNGETSEWIDASLSSAALGVVLSRYYKMTGRVIIDLMKVVQRDYKLSSYKLDYVASYFIREGVSNIEKYEKTFKVITKNTTGVNRGDYVTISYTEGAVENKYNEGQKFKIIDLAKDHLILDGIIDTDEFMGKGFKVFWCQAKDDISPNDIFRMFKGTSHDRAVVGKYCVMDCDLVSKLVAKLQVVTNNVSMANVCNVPLSYLFLRGQGIKIQSLVSKKCREKNHLIPLIQKKQKQDPIKKSIKQFSDKSDKKADQNKDEETEKSDKKLENLVYNLNNKNKEDEEVDDDDIGYEGAIVFEPKPGVYYDPIAVLDYGSLYPNSMIFRNFSHETFVNDPEYDNLPGYRYHEVTYNNNDGTTSTCRFAEKLDGTKGIIPEILMDLLGARKKFRKLAESEPDKFKASILDSLQLAYKVTANSLYGQTGASTSAICMKEIAASTTATGRESLQFAKYFIEEYYDEIINLALVDKDKYMKRIAEIFEYYPTDFEIDDIAIDEKTGIKTYNKKYIHVNTNINERIPDSKFIQKDVGYELECELYNAYNKKSDFYVEHEKILNKMGYTDLNMFVDKFVKTLESNTVIQRRSFITDLIEIIIEERNKKKSFYKKYSDDLEKMGYDTEDKFIDNFYKKLIKYDKKEEFIQVLKQNIDNMGYANRNELFEKFYEVVNDILSGYSVKPEIVYGDSVVGDTPLLLRHNNKIIIKRIESLGSEWNKYHDDKLQDDNIDYEVWSDSGWTKINKVIKHKTNKKIYEIVTNKGNVSVTEDHSLLNNLGDVIKPTELNLDTQLLTSLPDITNLEINKIENSVDCNLLMAYIEYKKINNNINNFKILEINEIVNLEEQWVYDLETENHHFHAGTGEIIVHNTDSVFFNMHFMNIETKDKLRDREGLKKAIQFGIWAGNLICILLPMPMNMVFEKVLWPFAIQGKKRYVGNLYEKNPNKFYQKSMGIELKRRDNAPIVKTMCSGIIDQLLNKHSSTGAYEFAQKCLMQIITGKFKMDKFIITKTLKGNSLTKSERVVEARKPKEQRTYADRTRIVHAVLADRMADREPGNRPLSNDRIPYIYIETKTEPKLQGERVETPEHIIKNKLKIDYLFYITNQIMKPSLKFLDLILVDAQNIFDEYIVREENRRHCMMPIQFYANNKSDDEFGKFDELMDDIIIKVDEKKKVNKKKNIGLEIFNTVWTLEDAVNENPNSKIAKHNTKKDSKKTKLKKVTSKKSDDIKLVNFDIVDMFD